MRRVGPAVVALLGRPVRVAVAAPDTFESSVGGIVRRGSTRLSVDAQGSGSTDS